MTSEAIKDLLGVMDIFCALIGVILKKVYVYCCLVTKLGLP